MSTYRKEPLSASTHGRGIKVTTTGPVDGTDTTIHQAVNSTTDRDIVTLWAYNDDTDDRWVEIGWGGTTIPDDVTRQTIPTKAGWVLIEAGRILRNNLTIVASAEVANKIVIKGEVIQARS
jgi:hypothetical protein